MRQSLLILLFAPVLLLLADCQESPWRDGEWLYGKHCASCHGAEGQGLGELIPPLAGADYLGKHRERLPCIIRQGLQDSIVVNGKIYNQPMAGIPQLSDIEITNLLNYLNNQWGNQYGVYKLEEVRRLLTACAR